MSAAFRDHFSRASDDYAKSRPTYPDALFARLAEAAPARAAAWDCATGYGQAALGLARHFAHVEATDASAQQIAQAIQAPNVRYSVQPAEKTSFAGESFDAVCVAQALHWFEVDRFYAEAKRVLKPRGLLLVVGYGWSTVSREIDAIMKRAVIGPIEPHWPKENKLLWDRYRDLPFPFEKVAFPELLIEVEWTAGQMVDYVGTWTATRRLLDLEPGFLEEAHAALAPAWGEQRRRVVSPLHVQCGRHDGR